MCRRSYGEASLLLVVLVTAMVFPDVAYAAGTGGGLPYESWFTTVRNSLTGPVAFTFGIVGIVGAGGTLIIGGELNAFLRTLLYIVLVMAFLVAANNVMSGLFGAGAVIA